MNRKIVTSALAAVMAVSTLGAASAATAQHRGPHAAPPHAQKHARRGPPPHVRHAPPPQVRHAPPAAYGRWQQSQRRYSAPRYVAPRGYQVRSWSYGQRMPAHYRSNAYVVNDYNRYGLRAPPRGYQYVRSGNDVVLTAVATGLITAVIAGLFN
ncbi:MAG: RcnB family protein [Brevundimonas sp.]|uniref:RcnB family protein n=1 Tax=Brevundimonas sp. TaxID=1871086 RepID=UPI00391C3C71